MSKAPHLDIALRYARDTWDDHGIEELQRLGARRFLDDLDAGRWDFKTALPEFCISIMTGLFTFAQAERLDGTPLRALPRRDHLIAWAETAAGPLLPGGNTVLHGGDRIGIGFAGGLHGNRRMIDTDQVSAGHGLRH